MSQLKEIRFVTTIMVQADVTLEALESAIGTFGQHLQVKPVYEVCAAESSSLEKRTIVLFDNARGVMAVNEFGDVEGRSMGAEELDTLRTEGVVVAGGILTADEDDHEQLIFQQVQTHGFKIDLQCYEKWDIDWQEREELLWLQIAHN